jgi:hypothetical protein
MSITPAFSTTAQPASTEEAHAIAQEAYIYLYPLLTMDITRKQLTNLDPNMSALGGPANAFTHVRAFPTADMRAVVGSSCTTSSRRSPASPMAGR